MYKKVLLSIIFICCSTVVFAQEIAVSITPAEIYTTCKNSPKEGDFLNFVTTKDVLNIKKGTPVQGLLTERTENGFSGQIATLYVEQFKLNKTPLKGIIYQKGNIHPIYFEYFDVFTFGILSLISGDQVSLVRGGEAFLIPEKNVYTLYLEQKE